MKRSWGWAGLCFALMLPVFLLGLSRNFAASHPGVHLAPFAMRQVEAAALALPLIPAMFMIGLVVARRWWWGVGVAVISLLVLGLAGGAALITVSSPDFLFGPKFVRTGISPTGQVAGHIFRSDFLICEFELFVGGPSDAVVVSTESVRCDGADPQVAWMGDGGARLAHPDGGLLQP